MYRKRLYSHENKAFFYLVEFDVLDEAFVEMAVEDFEHFAFGDGELMAQGCGVQLYEQHLVFDEHLFGAAGDRLAHHALP